jgi:glycosyltransferase involved in cell wall biosynthesis
MNILHINKSDSGGGAQQFSVDLAKEFGASLLVKYKHRNLSNVMRFKPNVFDLLFNTLDRVLKLLGVSRSVKQLFFLNEKYNFVYEKLKVLDAYKNADIIHLHNIHGGFFDLEDIILIAKEKKIVWTLHDMWIVTGGEIHTVDHLGYLVGDHKTPYIKNSPLSNPIIDKRGFYLEKKKHILTKCTSNLTIVPVSYWLENALKKSYVTNDDLNIKTIQNGVNTDVFFNKNQRKWSVPRVLFFNSNNPFKGSKYFRSVIEEIHIDFELYIVGNKLKDQGSRPLKYFNFISDRNELCNLYNEVDILVFPSVADTFPLTLLEAMACGVTVVATNVGGIPEIVSNNNGYLCTPRDDAALSQAMENCLADYQKGILKKGQNHILSNFNFKDMVDKYSCLYNELLSK